MLAVFTAADLAADNLGSNAPTLQRKRPDGTPMFWRAHQGLAQDRVRYVGDPVAMIVAEAIDAAKDAAELVDIAYEPLPSVTATAAAAGAGSAPRLGRMPRQRLATSSRSATRRRPMPPSPAPRMSSSGAMS